MIGFAPLAAIGVGVGLATGAQLVIRRGVRGSVLGGRVSETLLEMNVQMMVGVHRFQLLRVQSASYPFGYSVRGFGSVYYGRLPGQSAESMATMLEHAVSSAPSAVVGNRSVGVARTGSLAPHSTTVSVKRREDPETPIGVRLTSRRWTGFHTTWFWLTAEQAEALIERVRYGIRTHRELGGVPEY